MTGKTVLVAEADPRLRLQLALTLTHHLGETLSLVEASDDRAAIVQALHAKPDLIVLAEALPKLHGVQVCHELKKDPETAPIKILLLTARVGRIAGLLEADAYLQRRFDPGELVRTVERLLQL